MHSGKNAWQPLEVPEERSALLFEGLHGPERSCKNKTNVIQGRAHPHRHPDSFGLIYATSQAAVLQSHLWLTDPDNQIIASLLCMLFVVFHLQDMHPPANHSRVSRISHASVTSLAHRQATSIRR